LEEYARARSAHHVVQGADGGHDLIGYLLGQVTTRRDPDAPRWLEIEIWKVTESETGVEYVTHLVGRTVVYHATKNKTCNTGVEVRVGEIPDDEYETAEPCPKCKPGDLNDFPPGATVSMEKDRHTVHYCYTPQDAINSLKVAPPGKPKEEGVLSAPAQRLITQVTPRDKGIRDAVTVVHRV
jgi:hypothetical protein